MGEELRPDEEQSVMLSAALDYASRGWRIIPVSTKSKSPTMKEWQKKATTDPEQIRAWWKKWPRNNVGIVFGSDTGMVDFECDNPEDVKALLTLFDGDIPVTVTFKSAKGQHWLFKWRPDLPGGGTFKWGSLIIRIGNLGKGAQSLFPPSIHPTHKVEYKWVMHPDDCELAEIPDEVVTRLINWDGPEDKDAAEGNGKQRKPSVREKLYTQPEILETVDGRDNVIHAEACAQWNDQYRIHGAAAFDDPKIQSRVYAVMWAWNRAKCKPPLSDEEVRKKCESALTFVRGAVKKEDYERGKALTNLGLEFIDGEWYPGEWKAQIIRCDPRMVRLHAPFLPKKYIDLDMDRYYDPSGVDLAVARETGTVCLGKYPGFWAAVWNGTKGSKAQKTPSRIGVKAKLMDGAEWIDAPPEQKRLYAILTAFLDLMSTAYEPMKWEGPDPSGKPIRDPEGTVWFTFAYIWESLSRRPDKFTRNEISEFLVTNGIEWCQKRTSAGRARFFQVSKAKRVALRETE